MYVPLDTTKSTRHSRDEILQHEYRSVYQNNDRTLYLHVVAAGDEKKTITAEDFYLFFCGR